MQIKCILIFLVSTFATTALGQNEKNLPAGFIPNGFVLFDTVYGDLNSDDIEDYILIIKGTDTSKIVTDAYLGQLDRNRRGIIILFNYSNQYTPVLENRNCFSSENEDGGIYFAPELSFEIQNGNLKIQYGHGRYGFWEYTFRFQDSDFVLTGYYHSSSRGPAIDRIMRIDFLTKKKLVKENTNENAESGEEVFSETTSEITVDTLIRLSQITDFDALNMFVY